MLVDNGSCSPVTAVSLTAEACGYTDAETVQFADNAPAGEAAAGVHAQPARPHQMPLPQRTHRPPMQGQPGHGCPKRGS